jgi:hypothetical protein
MKCILYPDCIQLGPVTLSMMYLVERRSFHGNAYLISETL